MGTLIIAALLLQDATCHGDAARQMAEAARLGASFDLAGAAAAYEAAARLGCETARAPATFTRGLIAARAADAQFGSAASLQPLRQAIAALEPLASVDPVARAMQAVLLAAVPAAQHERPELALRIDDMLRLESLQLEAKQPPLPVMSAHEAAGYFWLQLHLYDQARNAFAEAARRVGRTAYVLLGAARTSVGRRDVAAACEQYTQLVSWWGRRTGSPPEVIEAREFIVQPQCAATPARPAGRP